MASLHFIYSTMNSGKTTSLLQTHYNYEERGMKSLLLKPIIDNRDGDKIIKSRIGLSAPCETFDLNCDLFELISKNQENVCVLVDEIQFVTEEQIDQLSNVVDLLGIPVMCYGLRTDFQGKAFPASARLLSIADKLKEMKTICFCGKKANFVLRTTATGKVIKKGPQVAVGGNDLYTSVCRGHFKKQVFN